MSKTRALAIGLSIAGVVASLTACSSSEEKVPAAATDCENVLNRSVNDLPSWIEKPDPIASGFRGANDNDPAWYSDLQITDEQVQQAKDKKFRAVFLDWAEAPYNNAIADGLKDTMGCLGGEVVSRTVSNFDLTKLSADVNNVLPLKPDIAVIGVIDPDATKAALQPLVDAGVKVVTLIQATKGWTAGKEYVTEIDYDTKQAGRITANAVAEKFPDGAKVGYIYWDQDTPSINQREKSFIDTIRSFGKFDVVAQEPISDPGNVEPVASGLLQRHPDVDVIFAPWDLPAQGVTAALAAAGKKDVKVIHYDLDPQAVTDMQTDGPVFGTTSSLVYEWGRTSALAGVVSALGGKVPPLLTVPTFAVTKDNAKEAWEIAYGPHLEFPGE